MPVNHEIKSQLAKLLATENLVVEHKKVETACFNVHTRVLTLPLWEKASGIVYDLLVGHEVGHALFTPDEDWSKQVKVPRQFVNVVEDARIEKLMKRRYAGLGKTFYGGYKELSDQDFFAIGDDDISTYNLADRANLYFKIGNYIRVEFNRKEQEIIDMINSCETFADVLLAAEELYKFCKIENRKRSKSSNSDSVSGEVEYDDLDDESDEDNSSEMGESDDEEEYDEEDGEGDEEDGEGDEEEDEDDDVDSEGGTTGGDTDDEEEEEEPEVKTVDQLEESIKDLVNQSGFENTYIEIPDLDLKSVIVPNVEIHKKCEDQWKDLSVFNDVDREYRKFKSSAQKEVNYLVKEFECRKAADSYSRALTARTGVLDCSKLHTYKFNDDIFKKVTTLPEGKNHGLVFILDWSGSMSKVMLDTIKQLYNLIWFCRKVSIPFEVYAFTSEYPRYTRDSKGRVKPPELAYKKKEGLFHVYETFSLMNIFTSKVNNQQIEIQMRNIFRIASKFSGNNYIRNYVRDCEVIPIGMDLSGTPLNESLIALHQILPKFQNENKLQKVHCVILTDGEACAIKYHKEFHRKWETEPFIGTSYLSAECFLRDRKTGNTYRINCEDKKIPDIFLRNLRDRFPNMSFIGIRILGSGSANSFIRDYCGNYGSEYKKVSDSWKKEKAFSMKTSGYHTYFGIASNALSRSSEFEVSENASKTQIKSAFINSLKTKKMNKKILSEFIELVS